MFIFLCLFVLYFRFQLTAWCLCVLGLSLSPEAFFLVAFSVCFRISPDNRLQSGKQGINVLTYNGGKNVVFIIHSLNTPGFYRTLKIRLLFTWPTLRLAINIGKASLDIYNMSEFAVICFYGWENTVDIVRFVYLYVSLFIVCLWTYFQVICRLSVKT